MLALVSTVAVCFGLQLVLVGPEWGAIFAGMVPREATLKDPQAVLVAIGIVGATVMPHNLYLHSSIVQTRHVLNDAASRRGAVSLATADTVLTLTLALVVNTEILTVAASAFHATGHTDVTEIRDAYRLLELRIPCWQRRVITRALAALPAFGTIAWLGEGAIGPLLVLSQVVLSFQLPFATWP